MLVKPREAKEGQLAMVVRDPRSRAKLPHEGAKVPDSSYWLRRLKCGDVVKTTAEAIAKGKNERLAEEARARADHMAKPKEEPATEDSAETDVDPEPEAPNVPMKSSHHSKRGKGRS